MLYYEITIIKSGINFKFNNQLELISSKCRTHSSPSTTFYPLNNICLFVISATHFHKLISQVTCCFPMSLLSSICHVSVASAVPSFFIPRNFSCLVLILDMNVHFGYVFLKTTSILTCSVQFMVFSASSCISTFLLPPVSSIFLKRLSRINCHGGRPVLHGSSLLFSVSLMKFSRVLIF